MTPAHPDFEETLNVVLNLKKNGLAEDTVEKYGRRLRFLAKKTDLKNPEIVKTFISNQKSSNANKEAYANAYDHYVKFYKLTWIKPFYHREERIPNVPTTEQVNSIISCFKLKYATIFSVLRDTGLRPIEIYTSILTPSFSKFIRIILLTSSVISFVGLFLSLPKVIKII